jgi:hypothetical protein
MEKALVAVGMIIQVYVTLAGVFVITLLGRVCLTGRPSATVASAK